MASILGAIAGGVRGLRDGEVDNRNKQHDFDLIELKQQITSDYEARIHERNKGESETRLTEQRTYDEGQLKEKRTYDEGVTEKKETKDYSRSQIAAATNMLKDATTNLKSLRIQLGNDPNNLSILDQIETEDERRSKATNYLNEHAKGVVGKPKALSVKPDSSSGMLEDKKAKAPTTSSFDPSKLDEIISGKKAGGENVTVSTAKEAKDISKLMRDNPNAFAAGQATAKTVEIVAKETGKVFTVPWDIYRDYIGKPFSEAISPFITGLTNSSEED